MLRWSAQETGRQVNIEAIVDSAVRSGIAGGRALVALGRAAVGNAVERDPLKSVAAQVGLPAAIDAAAVAANFEIMNRVVDGTGLPVGSHRRDAEHELIGILGLTQFPHAEH